MAKLVDGMAPGHWKITDVYGKFRCVDIDQDRHPSFPGDCPDFREHYKKEAEALDALPQDRIWSTGVADGRAMYLVVSEKPLVMCHIPQGDAYQAPGAHIRGLTLKDVKDFQRASVPPFRRKEQ